MNVLSLLLLLLDLYQNQSPNYTAILELVVSKTVHTISLSLLREMELYQVHTVLIPSETVGMENFIVMF